MADGFLVATLDRFENNLAVLVFNDGQELAIDRTLLSAGTHEGAKLTVKFLSNNQAEVNSEEAAHNLLTRILQGS